MMTPAGNADLETVRHIVRTTISTVYPHYYPLGAVEYFLAHHSDERIAQDISRGNVYLCLDADNTAVGTVTIKSDEIARLFVLPEYQGRGHGSELICFAEELIAKSYDESVIDASLPAKPIYLRRGYKETEYNIIDTDNNDHLCFDVMKKKLRREPK